MRIITMLGLMAALATTSLVAHADSCCKKEGSKCCKPGAACCEKK